MHFEATACNEPPPIETDNWRIHILFTQSALTQCVNLIKTNLATHGFQNAFALECLGMVQRLQGKVHESLDQFLMCVRLDPSSPSYKKHVARSLTLIGSHDEAIDLYHTALRQTPKDWELYYNQGLHHLLKKDWLLAEEYFLEAAKHTQNVMPLEKLAEARDKSGNISGAIDALKTALSLSPDDPDLLVRLAFLYVRAGEEGSVFENLGSALCLLPTHFHALLATGSVMLQQADYDAALAKFRLALKNAPENASLWNNIGMSLLGKRKFLGATYCLNRAIVLAPLDWSISANLGLVFLHTDQPMSALQHITAAIHLLRKQTKCAVSADMGHISTSTKFTLGMLYSLLAVALAKLKDPAAAEEAHMIACKNDRTQPSVPLNTAIGLAVTSQDQARQYLVEAEKRLQNLSGKLPNFSMESINTAQLGLKSLLKIS
ncbi:hypothetical protein CRM22_005158 [Opisthorchis felineus]|uniref:Uncharacterized protein n=1 Tax=Opisthorchis felineus TaxID=147828 RepID=A0A4S2LZ70_OPIFE|nr:hypothetical protein CRM22_005158 [Opisthorchis felineus]